MSDFFAQIVMFILGVVIGITVPLLPTPIQKQIAGILSVLLVVISLVWAGYELGSRQPSDSLDPETLLEVAQYWPAVHADSFETNDVGWANGPIINDEWHTGSRQIIDGKYVWKLEALKDESVREITPIIDPTADLYLAAQVRGVDSSGEYNLGLLFRKSGNNYYTFEISNYQSFRVGLLYENQWEDLIDWTRSSSIKPGEFNQLTIITQGSHFYFYVNNKYLTTTKDDRLESGNVGFKIVLPKAGDSGTFEFDDFELRRKP